MIERKILIEQAFATLGLPPFASIEQIKAQYRRLALTHHPDKVPFGQKQSAHDAFSRISAAYELLTNDRFSTRTQNNSILYGSFTDPYHLFRTYFQQPQEFPVACTVPTKFIANAPFRDLSRSNTANNKRGVNEVTPPSSPVVQAKRAKLMHHIDPPPMMLEQRSIKRNAYAVEDDSMSIEDYEDVHFPHQGSPKRRRVTPVCTY